MHFSEAKFEVSFSDETMQTTYKLTSPKLSCSAIIGRKLHSSVWFAITEELGKRFPLPFAAFCEERRHQVNIYILNGQLLGQHFLNLATITWSLQNAVQPALF